MSERAYLMDPHLGSRKIRSLVLPSIAKDLTNTLGFDGAFSLDFQRMTLIYIFLGFACAVSPVARTSVLDVCTNDMMALMTMMAFQIVCIFVDWQLGSSLAFLGYG